MKLKKIYKSIIFLFIIFLFILFIVKILYKHTIAEKVAESAFNAYLKEKNINKEEINNLNIYFDSKVGSGYFIEVEYNNEPNLIYEYFYKVSSQDLSYYTIKEKSTGLSIAIDKKIIPLHENVSMIYNKSFHTSEIVLHYTFFDYIKDLIYTKKDMTN